jgi:hypothetical protein
MIVKSSLEEGWGYSTVGRVLASMCEVLSLVLSTTARGVVMGRKKSFKEM